MADHPSYRVSPGGLMRCCLSTLDEEMLARAQTGQVSEDGQKVFCRYCTGEGMIRVGGIWKWDHD